MRALAALLALLLAGCSGNAPAGGEAAADPAPQAYAPALPQDIHDERLVAAGLDPFNWPVHLADSCGTPASTCFPYPFAALGNATVAARLAWGQPTNDFDLLLLRGDELVAEGRTPPPSAEEAWSAALAPGQYTLVVVAWLAAGDTYTLDATFA